MALFCMDRWWQRGEFEFDPTLSWWWGIQVTNCFLSLCILLQQFWKLGLQWYLFISQSVIDMWKMKVVIMSEYVGEINLFHFPKLSLQLCAIGSAKRCVKQSFTESEKYPLKMCMYLSAWNHCGKTEIGFCRWFP